MLISCGCREWRTQKNTFRDQRVKAGTLIGKTEADVVAALGKPTMTVQSGSEAILEYSYREARAYTSTGMGMVNTDEDSNTGDARTESMRLYFKGGKLESVKGN
jgi:hypothetical protein